MTRQYRVGDEPIPGYRLTKQMGQGRFGAVWRAAIPRGTEIALKIIPFVSADLKKIRSLRLLTKIKHPQMLATRGLWFKDENGIAVDPAQIDAGRTIAPLAEAVLALDLAEKNLADRLRECVEARWPGIPPEELLDYMEAVARAVDYLNQPTFDLGSGRLEALQHCNVKPTNLFLLSGAAKLGDAGLAHALGDSGGSLGTSAYYQPPELFLQGRPSPSSDQYSLAITYTELRTGAVPVQADSLHKIIASHLQGTLDLTRLPEAEQVVIRRATSVDPTQRYPSTVEMVRALRQTMNRAGSISPPPRSAKESVRSMDGHILLQPGVEIVPGYKLIRMIGRGGYGEVWESSAPGHLRIALKLVRNLDANTGKQEFKALQLIKNINHVYLLALHAYWLVDAQGQVIDDDVGDRPDAPVPSMLVLATRLADKSLMQRFKECQKESGTGIPGDELIEYMRQSAAAIDYLNAERHQMGDRLGSIQHRDIKPENILLTSGVAIVADFGLARLLQGSQSRVSADSMGLTPLYAAPELLSGSVSRWSDQYSLALTYFHMRVGATPFRDPSPYAVIQAHLEGKLDLTGLPEAERPVIARATARNAAARWPTCVDMVKALQEAMILAHHGASGRGGSGVPSAPPKHETGGPERSSTADPLQFETVMVPPVPGGGAAVAGPGQGTSPPPGKPTKKRTGFLAPSHQTRPPEAPTIGPLGSGQNWAQQAAAQGAAASPGWAAPAQAPPTARRGKWFLVALLFLLLAGIGGTLSWPHWRELVGFGPPKFTREQILIPIRGARYPEALAMIQDSRLGSHEKQELRGEVRAAWLKDIDTELDRGGDALVGDMTDQMLQSFPNDADVLGRRGTALDRFLKPQVTKAITDGQFPTALALLDKPNYESPLRQELQTNIRKAWLDQARGKIKEGRPADAVALLKQMLEKFPDNLDAGSLRRSAERDIIRGEFDQLVSDKKFGEAGQFLIREGSTFGPTVADQLKSQLLTGWYTYAKEETQKPRQIKLLKELLAFSQYEDARKLLFEVDPSSRTVSADAQQALTENIAAAEKLLPEDSTKALAVLDKVLKSEDIQNLGPLKTRAVYAKARAQGRASDWTDLPITLTALSTDLTSTQQAVTMVLKLLLQEARKSPPEEMLKFLGEIRPNIKALGKGESWERQQYDRARAGVLDSLLAQARERVQPPAGKPARPEEAQGLIDKVLNAEPEYVPALLAKADLLFRKPDFPGVRSVLAQARPLAKDPADLQEVNALTALVGVLPDASEKDRAAALQQMQTLLSGPAAPRQVPLCLALAEAARKDDGFRAGAAPVLAKAFAALTNEADKKRVSEAMAQLYRDTVADADTLLKDKKWPALTAALTDARVLALDPASQADVDSLRALLLLQQPGPLAQRAQGCELIQQLAKLPNPPPRALPLANTLVALAESEDAALPYVQPALTQLTARLSPADKEAIQKSMRRLGDKEVRAKLSATDKPPEWAQLLKEFRQGDPSDWKLVGQAECLLNVTPAEPKRARELLDGKPPPDVGPYGRYVRALVLRDEGNYPQAAAAILEAYQDEPVAPYLLGFRRDRAIRLLRDAATALRADNDDVTSPTRSPFRVPFTSPAAADQAVAALDKAMQLLRASGQPTSLDLQILHALGVAQQSKPNVAAAVKVLDAALTAPPDKLGGARLALLAGKARLQSTAKDSKPAIETYDDLAGQLLPRASYDEALALEFYAQVLERALQLADKAPPAGSDAEGKKRVARLHGAVGQIVTNYPAAKWPFRGDPLKRAIDAYSDALKLDDSRPDYFIGRGLARALLPEPDLEGMDADAKKAIATKGGETMAGAHNLRGYALLLEARRQGDPAQRVQKLRQAVAECTQAVELRRKQPDDPADLGILLNNLSTAALDLGNFLTDPVEKRQLFTQARSAAQEATEKNTDRDSDAAWRALGNVLEDIAWQLNESKSYDDAIQAFDQAIQKRPTNPKAYIDRGRCIWRAVTNAGRDRADLAKAEKSLQDALTRNPQGDDKVQALSWLGIVYLERQDYAKAAALAFDDAIKEAQKLKGVHWPRYVLDWARAAVAESARLRSQPPKAKLATDLLDAARKAVERTFEAVKGGATDEVWRFEAALMLGSIYETLPALPKALRVYLDALPDKDLAVLENAPDNRLADGTGLRFRFLLKRGAFLLKNFQTPEFAQAVTGAGGPLELARRDLALTVRLAAVEKILGEDDRMTAFGLSGLAHERAATLNKVEKHRATAVQHLEEAVKFANAKSHPDCWLWRFRVGDFYSKKMPGAATSKEKDDFYKKGKANLEASLKALPVADLTAKEKQDYQTAITQAIGRLDEAYKKQP
ncbi:hypothetical protein AYO44_01825 [Planctomycetaceae bacterium SCGC AG-212-F19]|nr:hypothetical protein AYO44_01825 [Planctomycetaceae bacterium SCGC AG-212-F19]